MERVHRLNTKSSPAPIIAKFSFSKDRNRVLKSYRHKRKDERELAAAEGRNDDADQASETVRVGEDFPVRVRNERKCFMPFLKNVFLKRKMLTLRMLNL